MYRIEELEAAIASALRVNKLLNTQVESYIATADLVKTWQLHAGHDFIEDPCRFCL